MNLLSLRKGVVLEQWLDMLPARKAADLADLGKINDLGQTIARGIAKNGSFHVRWLVILH